MLPSPRHLSSKYDRSSPAGSCAEDTNDKMNAPPCHTAHLHCCTPSIPCSASFSRNASKHRLRAHLEANTSVRASTNSAAANAEAQLRAALGRLLSASSVHPSWAEEAQRVMQQLFLQHSQCCSSLFCSGSVASLEKHVDSLRNQLQTSLQWSGAQEFIKVLLPS